MPQPAQRGTLGASVDVLTGCFAAASTDVVASTPLDRVLAASAVSLSPKSFPRAGGSRDGHCPCYVKKVSCSDDTSTVSAAPSLCTTGSSEASRFTAPAMLSSTIRAPYRKMPLRQLLQVRGVYNVRKAPTAVAEAMKRTAPCSPAYAVFKLIGENSLQIRSKLNKQLARELAAGVHEAAFAAICDLQAYPRADDIEGMVAAFPAWDAINWEASAVASGLDVGLWQAWHARHCKSCTATAIDDSCYFKLIHHFL